jgi:tRNA (guanine-N7-)-methyltransferase
MRVRYQPLALETIAESRAVIHDTRLITDAFEKDQPLVLEIGCGKGQFIRELALTQPTFNYVGIEQQSSVLYHALHDKEILPNLRFIHGDIDKLFEDVNHHVEEIYLLFSDPWPKKRHAKRRLTHHKRLQAYATLTNHLHIRTDNQGLYDYSVDELSQSPFQIQEHGILKATNSLIMSEFEVKYRKLKKPIYYIEANQ